MRMRSHDHSVIAETAIERLAGEVMQKAVTSLGKRPHAATVQPFGIGFL